MDWNLILENMETAAQTMSYWELAAVITGIIYVVLAAKENIWCWLFGIISSAIYIFLFIQAQLYAESFLYSYYVIAGLYGWYAWQKRRPIKTVEDSETTALKISSWSLKNHALIIVTGILLSLVLFLLLKQYTNAALPLIDAHTTIFSFMATYMVTQKLLYNWIYWIIIDLVSIGLYASRELYLSSGLMIIYTIVAIIGFIKWRKIYLQQASSSLS